MEGDSVDDGYVFHLTTWAISRDILLPKTICKAEVTGSRTPVVLQGNVSQALVGLTNTKKI